MSIEHFIELLDTMTTADIIRLYLIINKKYEHVKSTTNNFAVAKWAVLNPDKVKANNRKQQKKNRLNKQNDNN